MSFLSCICHNRKIAVVISIWADLCSIEFYPTTDSGKCNGAPFRSCKQKLGREWDHIFSRKKLDLDFEQFPPISLGLIWFRLAENVIGTLLVHRNKTSSETLAHKCILCRNTKTFYLGQGSKASSSDSESFKLLKRPGPDFRTGDETRSRRKIWLASELAIRW